MRAHVVIVTPESALPRGLHLRSEDQARKVEQGTLVVAVGARRLGHRGVRAPLVRSLSPPRLAVLLSRVVDEMGHWLHLWSCRRLTHHGSVMQTRAVGATVSCVLVVVGVAGWQVVGSFVGSFVCSFVGSFVCSFVCSFVGWLVGWVVVALKATIEELSVRAQSEAQLKLDFRRKRPPQRLHIQVGGFF